MEERERRRALSLQAAVRAQREHLKVVHPDGTQDCACERSPFFFRKRKSLSCNCRGRKHGQPKLGTGPCCRHDFRPRRLGRAAWRRDRHLWMAGVVADDRRALVEGRS